MDGWIYMPRYSEMLFLCQKLHYYPDSWIIYSNNGEAGIRMVTARSWGDTGRCFAQSCHQNGLGPNILQDQQLLDFWVILSCSTPLSVSYPAPAFPGITGYSATQAITEFLSHRNNLLQPLKLVLLQFNLCFKNKIKSTFFISCSNDFPCKLILKLIHWCRRMLKTLNT